MLLINGLILSVNIAVM